MHITTTTPFDDICERAAEALDNGYDYFHVATGRGSGAFERAIWLGGMHQGTGTWLTPASEDLLHRRLVEARIPFDNADSLGNRCTVPFDIWEDLLRSLPHTIGEAPCYLDHDEAAHALDLLNSYTTAERDYMVMRRVRWSDGSIRYYLIPHITAVMRCI